MTDPKQPSLLHLAHMLRAGIASDTPRAVMQSIAAELEHLSSDAASLVWQPIETAPKGGTAVLLAEWEQYGQRWRFGTSYWRDYIPGYGAGFGWVGHTPTHWAPLPPARCLNGSPLGSGARPDEQDAPGSSIGLGAEGEQ